ncbi:FkbM family methyltransferase [Flavobacterium aquiphilum]|uniref:FkbM family methyltransferase n=1 Tax=Flavobacterium aquiphilum TaxID=3003261 RepID=UPI00248093E0|nr:FkbM family methyltransferase [Flavobacterium aquiphilum]
MLNKIKELIRRKIYSRYNISFSKSGEDMQLKQLLGSNHRGIYVDVGCWDPIKASNSYYFHLRGWKGICIDPNPQMKDLFLQKRSSDIFVNVAIGSGNEDLIYYMLENQYSSMNTLDFDFIKNNNLENKVVNEIKITTVSLKAVLEKHISETDQIDFLDIDVEGFDLNVLKSNDWNKFRPKVILIETALDLKNDFGNELSLYLFEQNYILAGKTLINKSLGNLFFIDAQN